MLVFYVLLLDPNKKTKQVESQDESHKQERTKLSEGLKLGRRSYVMNPKFSTSTSLPLYFYLGYQVLQENAEYMKECGKVSSFDIFPDIVFNSREKCIDKGVIL